MAEEIASSRAGGPLSNLFPEDVQQEVGRRYQHIQSQKNRFLVLGKVWVGLVAASLATLLISSINKRQALTFWIPVVLILGPLGILIWLAVRRKPSAGTWQRILVEAVGDATPSVIAFMLFAVVGFFVPAVQGSQIFQVLLIFSSPLLVGLPVFQGPLLALANRKGYLPTLLKRLPHTWVTANLGIAGIFALATPLVNLSLQIPLPLWTLATWWAFAVSSALAAILLLLLYEGWCAHRGYQAWSILAWGEAEVTSAPWRKLWWWILLSIAVLIGGVAGYAILQQVLS